MVKARKYVLAKHFQGEPKKSDLKIIEEDLPELEDGEFLVKAEYLSVDPYMRIYMFRFPVGTTMVGTQVGRVVTSRNNDFPIGKLVVGDYGWRDYTIDGGKNFEKPSVFVPTYLLPDIGDLPPSLGLGILGMPGNTAYFGLLEICQPKEGETVVVSGAAGAVGSIVGQIAKIKGCRVIGFAGSDAKCKWLKQEMGFDYAYNYKTVNPTTALKESAPKGIDCYFDNVGGDFSPLVINQMNQCGRISVCGSTSTYNEDPFELPLVANLQPKFVSNQLKMEGFIVHRWAARWTEGILQNLKWIKEGRLKYRETVVDGFDNMYEAFVGMFHGDNTGKAIIKA